MKDHKGCIRAYHRSSKAWYNKTAVRGIEIMFGMYCEEGGTSGEMSMVWENLDEKLVPKLKCFDDGWSALSLFTDLIQKMGEIDDECISEEDFAKLLDECGFKDITAYDSPYQEFKEETVTIEIPVSKAKKLN